MLTSKLATCGVLTSVMLVAAACSHDNAEASSPQLASNPPATAAVPPPSPTPIDSAASAQTVAVVDASSTPLSDDDIVAVIEAINKSQVQQAQLATTKGQSSAVTSFANMIVAEDTAALQGEQAMATESKLVANTSNGTCQTLVAYVRQEINTLQSKSGSEFDTAYIDEMVHGHQKGLRLINDALIPNARNAELKVQLQSLKTQVELQLRRAEDAQRTLSWQNAAAPSLNTSNARP